MRIVLSLLLAFAPLAAASAEPAPVLSQSERRLASLRPVIVDVPQDTIGTSIDIGRVAADPSGGGLLGAILVESGDNKAQILAANASERAEQTIAPLREALAGFDAETLALDTAGKAITASDWFGPSTIALVSYWDGDARSEFAAANPAEQIGIVQFHYQLSPDFTQIQVIAEIGLASPKDWRQFYLQRVVSLVQLKQRSYDEGTNVARWAANDGQLAREALTAAFARLEAIIPQVLALDHAGFDKATGKKREKQLVAGFYGPVLMRDALGPVIWSKDLGFVTAQSAGD